MIKLSLLFLISLFGLKGFAQEYPNLISSSTVSTIAYWNKGDKATYKVSKKKKSFRNSAVAPIAESSEEYIINLLVADSTEKGYTVHMTYSGFGGANTGKSDLESKLTALQNGLTVKYKIDEFGTFQEIINLNELAGELKKMFGGFKKDVASDPKLSADEKSMYGQMVDYMELTFGRIENIEPLFIEEILALHGYYGYEFKLNEPSAADIEFPVLTGNALPGLATIKVTNINKSADRFTLSISQEPDKNELEKYIMKIVKIMIPESKKELNRSEMNASLQSVITYEMTLSTGWVTKLISTSKTEVAAETEKRKAEQTVTYTKL